MRTDVPVIQTEMKDVVIERDTLQRHMQGSYSRDGCWKGPIKPREIVVEYKKGAKVSLLGIREVGQEDRRT